MTVLELNGIQFVAKEEDATQAIRLLAAGGLNEGGFRNWLRDNITGTEKRPEKKKV